MVADSTLRGFGQGDGVRESGRVAATCVDAFSQGEGIVNRGRPVHRQGAS